MHMSGELLAPAAVPYGNILRTHKKGDEWALESVWTL
jgi:hypothetical protein